MRLLPVLVLCALAVCITHGQGNARGAGALAAASGQLLFKMLGGCRDIYPDSSKCRLWKSKGMCQMKPKNMHRLCRFTCGACQSPIGRCVNGVMDFLCDRYAMTKQCAAEDAESCDDSCGKCSRTEKEYLVSLFMTTWNAADEPPGEVDLETWMGVAGESRPDIVVLGMQEMGQPQLWLQKIKLIMKQKGYREIGVLNMGKITEAVFIKAPLGATVHGINSARKGTGLAEVYVNKGGVIIVFSIGDRSFAFVTSHLAAHQNASPARIKDYKQIFNHRMFGFAPDLDTFDYIFWQGDLNFRVDLPKPMVETLIKKNNLGAILAKDQLLNLRVKKMIFEDFEEAPITFAPTYKFDKNSNTYDTGPKQRIPSWTDRILWREKRGRDARVWPYEYFSREEFDISDHKPVGLLAFVTI